MAYTKEEKKAYFKGLRDQWKKSKAMAETDDKLKAIYKESGGKFSYWSFAFTYYAMQSKGLDGLPYIDCKTFGGWKDSGFMVKKGEKSVIKGISWKDINEENEEKEEYLIPVTYNLFHKSQVEEI